MAIEFVVGDAVFFGIALFAVLTSLLVVTSNNLFHSSVFLAMAFLGFGMVYIQLGAVFVGAIQILIYAGAVTMLLMFVIMLTKAHKDDDAKKAAGEVSLFGKVAQLPWQKFVAAILALFILALFLHVLMPVEWNLAPAPPSGTVWDIAGLFLGQYLLPFEVASVLLLVALIGAVVLARTDDEPLLTDADEASDAKSNPKNGGGA